jgi:hypothetical protein
MTDHIQGDGSYLECDRYSVVSVVSTGEMYSNLEAKDHRKSYCYCGKEATQIATVGFYTVVEERDDWWDRTLCQTAKAHRCEAHSFEEPEQ